MGRGKTDRWIDGKMGMRSTYDRATKAHVNVYPSLSLSRGRPAISSCVIKLKLYPREPRLRKYNESTTPARPARLLRRDDGFTLWQMEWGCGHSPHPASQPKIEPACPSRRPPMSTAHAGRRKKCRDPFVVLMCEPLPRALTGPAY